MDNLIGQTAVITGGTTGIGFATAERFLREGARVIITGQNSERLSAALAKLGDGASGVIVDQTKICDIPELVRIVQTNFQSLDTLFLNAGVATPALTEAETEDHFDRQVMINLKAPFFIMQQLVRFMKDGGSVILCTSCLDRLGMPDMAVYSATKAALRSLVRTWAAEYMSKGIRVNSIAPGPIKTASYGKLGLNPTDLERLTSAIKARVPMRRFGTPEEIAGAVSFMASADASFMTGEEITIDGGWTEL